jgi:hypothetical protein
MHLLTCALMSVLALGSVRSPASPKVASITLEDLVRFSDVVVVGKVEREAPILRTNAAERQSPDAFDEVPNEVRIAEIKVSRVLKGPAPLDTVLYLATPTWTCDVTTANVGESALFFLSGSAGDKVIDDLLRADIHSVFPQGEAMRLMWAGRGRMPLGPRGVTYWTDVIMPEDCPDVDGPEPKYSTFIRSVSLTWISDAILKAVEEQRRLWLRASVADVREGAWDLELTRDRHGRVVVHEPSGDRERKFVLDSESGMGLLRALRRIRTDAIPETIGTGHPALGVRRFEIEAAGGAWKLRILSIDDAWMSRPGNAEPARVALGVWRDIRASFDDAACADHRSTDARWLEEKR